ncbi:MATH and LRR domain-containing protein PFE0570w-like [Leptopilina heterotoma]|uniref:MATH and LRR domain-containing protein PFE0570w-like n=1 Tax=Leptopilina heterotoma TaxID=63436 RepID=UPI001CA8EA0E|nr:MATH and LRR domain-containing protein PFE0570w-like [Leptopilina heterotoma]
MGIVYEAMLRRGYIEKWKSEGYSFEAMDHKNNFRDPESRNLQHRFTDEEHEDVRDECRRYNNIQDDYEREEHRDYRCYDYDESYMINDNFETNQYQNNYNVRRDVHRMEKSDYERGFDDNMDYEDRYNYQDANNQCSMYEPNTQNNYYEPIGEKWQIRNQQQSEQFNRRIYDNKEFDYQNRNTDLEEHWQNTDMTSQGYERENFNNRNQYFQDYNTNSRRYNEQQKIYRRLCNRQEPSFNNDYYRRDYFINKRKFNRELDEDFVIPPVIFRESLTHINLVKDTEQWDHNISPSINELQPAIESEESSDKKSIHSKEKPLEEEQIVEYMNPIMDSSNDEEDISISEELQEKEMKEFLDNEMFEDDEENKEDTLQKSDSERLYFTMESKKEDKLNNHACPINKVLQPENDISNFKVNHKLNEIKSDKKINKKIIEKNKELSDIIQVNNENVLIIDNSYSLIEHMNSDNSMTKLRKGKPPGKIKSITQEKLSIKNEEGSKEEKFSVQVSNADVIISTNTYAEIEEFIINKILSSGKSLNQEILEMIEYYISIHDQLSRTHQKYFWDTFLLDTNEKNEVIYKFEENEILQSKIPKIVVTKIPFNRLGIG